MSSEALDVEPDEVSGAGRRAGLVGGAARGPAVLPRSRSIARGRPPRRLVEAFVSQNTRRAYTGALRRLDAWLDGRPLEDATLAAVLAVAAAGASPRMSPSSAVGSTPCEPCYVRLGIMDGTPRWRGTLLLDAGAS